MAITIDWATLTFSVPQADLTNVVGTLYELDTESGFRQEVNMIMSSEEGIVFEDPIRHNTPVTVAGTTFARTIEVINGYSLTFTPDSAWSVRLAGSNNNLFDVENNILNQNGVQVIAQNSAGLIQGQVVADIFDNALIETGLTFRQAMRLLTSAAAGLVSGAAGTNVQITNAGPQDKTRIDATVDANGNRTAITYDTSD